MFSIVIQGGLGNQLFQIFAALSYSITYHKKLILPFYLESWDKRNTYWNNMFNCELINNILYDNKRNTYTDYKKYNDDTEFKYNEIPEMEEFILDGYFQSYKYFEKNYKQICEILTINEKREMVKQSYYHDNNTISLHFRMGDYKNAHAYHPIITDEYYINAIKYIINNTKQENWTIFYTCEKEDDDIVINRIYNIGRHFSKIQFIKVNNRLEDWEQMLFMSLCEHNIIANSTFSWWSAYMNDNPMKIVCYPSIWFGSANSHLNIKDLHPESWIKI